MKRKRLFIRFTACFSLLLVAASCSKSADALPLLVDPVFHLKFDTNTVRFPAAPENLTTLCADLKNARYDRQSYVFAETASAGTRYMLIGGFFVNRPAGARITDPSGAALKITGDKCVPLDPARDFLDFPPAQLPAAVLTDLAHDAACRYSRAFGGFEKLSLALKRANVDVNSLASPSLKQAFSQPPSNCP